MEMDIVTLGTAHLDAVAALYRRVTHAVPHCRFTSSPQAIARALLHADPEHTHLLVAIQAGVPRGIAALYDTGCRAGGRRVAAVSALFVDDAQAGALLLEALTVQARARGVRRLRAFPPTHFQCPVPGYNGGWDGLSDRLGLVAHLLVRHGFTPFHRELHLECSGASFPPPVVSAPGGISTIRRTDPSGHAVVAALGDGQEVGTCEYSRLEGLSDDPRAVQWGYIWGLDVAATQRRRGIGRFLLSCALTDLWAQGCTGCWLTTTATNWPAQALYLALGFVVVDGSTCFRTDIRHAVVTS